MGFGEGAQMMALDGGDLGSDLTRGDTLALSDALSRWERFRVGF